MPAPMSKGERTRLSIIQAAGSLFIEQGYHATSMRQIAHRAGLALGGIYNHFESKEQIFDHVLVEMHPYRQVLDILLSAPRENAERFIHDAAATAVKELVNRPDFLKLVFIELSEFKGSHAPHLFREIFPKFSGTVGSYLASTNQVRDDLPLQAVLFSFLGMLFSYYLTVSVANQPGALPSAPAALEHYLDILMHGVLKAEKP